SARNPCFVLSQNARRAPADKNRALSVPVSPCFSQLTATTCSSGRQSQSSPFCAQTPWPYWVILPAIHPAFGKAAMMSQTSCVLPMLRVCPPTTIRRQRDSDMALSLTFLMQPDGLDRGSSTYRPTSEGGLYNCRRQSAASSLVLGWCRDLLEW